MAWFKSMGCLLADLRHTGLLCLAVSESRVIVVNLQGSVAPSFHPWHFGVYRTDCSMIFDCWQRTGIVC
jgi:hypothetical protein